MKYLFGVALFVGCSTPCDDLLTVREQDLIIENIIEREEQPMGVVFALEACFFPPFFGEGSLECRECIEWLAEEAE